MRSCRLTGRSNLVTEKILDTPMRMLIRKFPDIAEKVLDKCYKEKNNQNKSFVEMNYEFIEDSFNYQQKKTSETKWFSMFTSGNDSGYEHVTEVSNINASEGFEVPYSTDHELIVRNHPMMIMAEHSRRVKVFEKDIDLIFIF